MHWISTSLPTAARLVLGLVFFVFGLNGFLGFLPEPPLPERAIPFVSGLASADYFFPLLKGVEVVAGALLIAGVLVPLALTMLAPITLNIAAFHLALAPGNYALVALIVAAQLYLAWTHRASFAPLFARTARPRSSSAAVAADAAPARSSLRDAA